MQDGFAVTEGVVDVDTLARLRNAFDAPVQDGAGGIRNVLRDIAEVRHAANSSAIRDLVTPFLGSDCIAVRGILFDKTADGGNWKVPYHQDLSIAVSLRMDLPEWGPWTEKAGVTHVQPPVAILERLLTVRLHIDDCDVANGPLRVLPGTHRHGRLSVPEIARYRETIRETICTVAAGGVVQMRPLLLHASSPVTQPGVRRRVLHIEYAAGDIRLPDGLDWHERIAP